MYNFSQFNPIYLLFIALTLLFLPSKADAYIDPNTGGFFFTTILPFVYGILAAIVIFWKRITNAFKKIFLKNKGANDS